MQRRINKYGALFDTNMEPRPWPLLPFSSTFRCLAMPLYVCPAKYCGNVGP